MAGLGAELDAAALALMEALEALQERRQNLERVLREGWLSLSQARYSLGCHRVSALQYGASMEPRVRVLPRQDPGAPPRFEEVPGTGGDPEDPQEGEGKGLRQRRGPPEKGGAPPRPPPDPLTWFGVLVPLPLRRAQGSFSQAVSLVLDVATLQSAVAAAAARDITACDGDISARDGDVTAQDSDVITHDNDITQDSDVSTTVTSPLATVTSALVSVTSLPVTVQLPLATVTSPPVTMMSPLAAVTSSLVTCHRVPNKDNGSRWFCVAFGAILAPL
ncbi:coiled-coil domain-containing protein 115 [Pezoporus wallicus]|uniref:coiled-coil domain-containing protein 115 n=1 Tax=Pezoporus wallicus TaxID=35540 RepID=UPI00254CFCDC|nr:coiled-coil domain-containing protein 115 [Pezoporus wallicus]